MNTSGADFCRFDRARFFAGLGGCPLGRELYGFAEVSSTNDFLKERAGALAHGTAAVADRQTAGRGRRGKRWDFPEGAALALSILLRFAEPEALLPLLCAAAARRTAAALGAAQAGIKWPNDIVCGGGKLCGILCEARTAPTGRAGENPWAAVCGFGINLGQNKAAFARAGLPGAVSLQMLCGRTAAPEDAAAILCRELAALLAGLEADGGASLLREYRAHCVTLGKRVLYTAGSEAAAEGDALDVTPDGSLLVRGSQGPVALRAGEVSVRGPGGYA